MLKKYFILTGIVLLSFASFSQVVSEVRRHFEEMVFNTIVHRNARLAEAPSVGKPVILYDANSKGSMNYLNLAKEILQKNDMTKIKKE